MQMHGAAAPLQPEQLGTTLSIPGARAVDHAVFVVPDLEAAISFFTRILGDTVLWKSAPFSALKDEPKAPEGINAASGAAFQLAMLRLGPNLNVELTESHVPGGRPGMPLSSDLCVGHFAIAVDEMKDAGAWLSAANVQLLAGPRHSARGPNAGQDSWFFLTPWGMAIELVERPEHMPYEHDTTARLFTRPD